MTHARKDANSSTNPGMRVRIGEGDTPMPTVEERIEAAGPWVGPGDGTTMSAEYDLGGTVPREEANWRTFRSADVYIRLETTIYGPLSQQDLVDLLQSGQLTGYESASNDLQHWTPLLYHPRMNITGQADPDQTHSILEGRSTLPTASARKRSLLEDLADGNLDDLEPPPEEPTGAMPLAAIMIRPRRVPASEVRNRQLPVFGEIRETNSGVARIERSAPGTTAPIAPRPPHPSDTPVPGGSAETYEVFEIYDEFERAPTDPATPLLRAPVDDDFDDFTPGSEEPTAPQHAVADDEGDDEGDNAPAGADLPADTSLLPPVWLLVLLIVVVLAIGVWVTWTRYLGAS